MSEFEEMIDDVCQGYEFAFDECLEAEGLTETPELKLIFFASLRQYLIENPAPEKEAQVKILKFFDEKLKEAVEELKMVDIVKEIASTLQAW